MEIRLATVSDIASVLALHRKYHISTIAEVDKSDGFISSSFNEKQLEELIERERGLTVAIANEKVVAYVMAASWHFWSTWPIQSYMISMLGKYEFCGQVLSVDNSYQYGPICVDKEFRGTGLFEEIFKFSLAEMASRYPFLVTFINRLNPRSYHAHTKKIGLSVLGEFSCNSNNYYWLICKTSHV